MSDYQKLKKTMVKRSTDQKLRLPNFDARNEVEVRRAKGPSGSPSGKSIFAQNYLVTVGSLPNVNFVSQNRVLNSATSARFRTGRLRNNHIKSRKRVVTKVQ